jgi:hypothetical protein
VLTLPANGAVASTLVKIARSAGGKIFQKSLATRFAPCDFYFVI